MRIIKGIIVSGLLVLGIWVFFSYYSFLFSRTVQGEVMEVEKVELNSAILARPQKDIPFLHSFAIAVREAGGEIVTASSEDRQWAVVKPGLCVEAKFFPYPPWNLEKAGSYFGARLLRLYECEKK